MYVCTFCRMERSLVAKGPEVCICEPCLAAIETGESVEDHDRCSFCNNNERRSWFRFRNRSIIGVGRFGDVRICSVCVPIAREALEHNRMLAAREKS